MDDYISRGEYNAEIKRIDDENNRQNHRLDNIEKIVDKINDLAASIREMTASLTAVQKEMEKQGQRLEAIESEPRENWKTLMRTAITVIVSAIVGFFLAKGGM